jgi:hypothetical protein
MPQPSSDQIIREAREKRRAQIAAISQKAAQKILARVNKGSLSVDSLAELIATEFAQMTGQKLQRFSRYAVRSKRPSVTKEENAQFFYGLEGQLAANPTRRAILHWSRFLARSALRRGANRVVSVRRCIRQKARFELDARRHPPSKGARCPGVVQAPVPQLIDRLRPERLSKPDLAELFQHLSEAFGK